MDSSAERTLNNLHVLSAISHNDKLMTNDDSFDIYVPTSLRGMLRMWYGERRSQNVQRVRQTVRDGIAFASRSLDEATAVLHTLGESDMARLRVATTVLQHARMVSALERCRGGLRNLRQTYREDAALASQITLLIEEIDDFVRVMLPHSSQLRSRCGMSLPALIDESEET